MVDELDIRNHLEQLQQLCMVCTKKKCTDHTKVCALKKLAWNYAKKRYVKQIKEGTK